MKIRMLSFLVVVCLFGCFVYAAKRIPSGPSSPKKTKAQSRITEDLAPTPVNFEAESSESESGSGSGSESGTLGAGSQDGSDFSFGSQVSFGVRESSDSESESERAEFGEGSVGADSESDDEAARIVVVLNGPSGAGKSSIARALNGKKIDGADWEILAMDGIKDREAKIKKSDEEDVRQEKIIKTLVEQINDSVEDGNNVICDVMLKDDAQIKKFKKNLFQGIRLIMCFVHNPLPRLLQNLERRNKLARASKGDFEERGFGQVMKDFGEFYTSGETDENLGILSPDGINQAMQSEEAKLFLQKNSLDVEAYLDRILRFAYPIFAIKEQTFLNLRFGEYDLIVNNTTPEDAAAQILSYIKHK